MTGPPLIDRAVIDDMFDYIGADSARSVLELFVSESRNYLAIIAEASAHPADAARRERARRAAHSLKSGAGQIGLPAVAAAAASVECAAAPNAPDLIQAAAALQQCTAVTIEALRHLLNSA